MTILKKKIFGLILILGAVISLAFWELWGRENIGYVQVPVFTESMDKYAVVGLNQIESIRIEKPKAQMVKWDDVEKLIGKQTKQYIPQGEPLYWEYFQNSNFAVGGSTGKFILSIPEVWLYSYPQTLRRGDRVYFYCKGELVTDAIVAYARTSGNQEVYSVNNDRLQGTSTVSLIEVIVTEEQAKLLGQLSDKGSRFVLLYC